LAPLSSARSAIRFFLALAIIVAGLAGRSAVDKVLALRGGAELVAAWAQLSSLIDVVAGASLAGVGAGVTVYVAQAATRGQQLAALRGGLLIGLAISAVVALAVLPLTVLGAVVGLAAVIPGTVNAYWLGQQRRGAMLALAVASTLLALIAALLAPRNAVLEALAIATAIPALAGLLVVKAMHGARSLGEPLRRYILPGLAVGILSPASLVAARAVVGDVLSWHEAGVLQALWRLADWVCVVAAGILSLIFLPQLAAARSDAEFNALLARAAKMVLLPSAIVFAALYVLHRPLLAALYEPSVRASDTAVALLLAGSWVRIVAWLPLFALYALRRTRAIAVGELLSLPLFAALVTAAGSQLTLELAGGFWLAAYIAYAVFNFWAARR
jgi:O-antigen/teichoic acid export membrane protein